MTNYTFEDRFLIKVSLLIIWITVNPQNILANSGSLTHTNQVKSVNAGLASNPADTLREYILKPGESISAKINSNLFVRAEAQKTTCYLGEPILITYKLYSRLSATSSITKQPRLGGFSVYDMTDFISLANSVEIINKRAFKVYVLKKSQLVPLMAGTLSLDAMELDNRVHFLKVGESPSVDTKNLDDLLVQLTNEESAPTIDHNVKIASKPLAITVRDFPVMARPVNFNGATGNFTIGVIANTDNVTAHAPIILKIEIKGSGNIPLMEAPKIDWPAGIDSLDMRSTDDIDRSAVPFRGTKTFEFRFSASKAGNYMIPPISFSFFDPGTRTYKTIYSQPNNFHVSADNNETAVNVKPRPDSIANNDFTIKSVFSSGMKYWSVTMIALLFSFLCSFIWWRKIKFKKNSLKSAAEEKSTLTKGENGTTDILSNSKTCLENGDYKGFYSSLNQVLWNELTIKLKLPPSEMNKHNIILALNAQGWTVNMTERLKKVLTIYERSKYLPDYRQDIDSAGMLKLMEILLGDLRDS